MYYLIQNAPLKWPEMSKHGLEVSPEGQDLINRMLCKDRKKRLGQTSDVDEILSHPFFNGINIDDLLDKKIKAPFVPVIKDIKDLSNFDSSITEMETGESIVAPASVAKI